MDCCINTSGNWLHYIFRVYVGEVQSMAIRGILSVHFVYKFFKICEKPYIVSQVYIAFCLFLYQVKNSLPTVFDGIRHRICDVPCKVVKLKTC